MDPLTQLEDLARLHLEGSISNEEFARRKAGLLGHRLHDSEGRRRWLRLLSATISVVILTSAVYFVSAKQAASPKTPPPEETVPATVAANLQNSLAHPPLNIENSIWSAQLEEHAGELVCVLRAVVEPEKTSFTFNVRTGVASFHLRNPDLVAPTPGQEKGTSHFLFPDGTDVRGLGSYAKGSTDVLIMDGASFFKHVASAKALEYFENSGGVDGTIWLNGPQPSQELASCLHQAR